MRRDNSLITQTLERWGFKHVPVLIISPVVWLRQSQCFLVQAFPESLQEGCFLNYSEKGLKFPSDLWCSTWWRIRKWKMQIDVDKQKVMHIGRKCSCFRQSENLWNSCSGKVLEQDSFWKLQLSAQERSNGKCSWERHSKGLCAGCQYTIQLSFFQKWRGTEKDTKIREKDGQKLLCKEKLSRPGPFSWEKTLLRKQMRELLKIMEVVGT